MTRRGRLSREAVAALPTGSPAEILLGVQLEQAGLQSWNDRYGGWEREATFIDGRRFRADFLWKGHRLIVEVEGGTWVAGRHSRGKGFESDTEKQALAMIHGYRYLRVTTAQVEDGRALSWIRQLIANREAA